MATDWMITGAGKQQPTKWGGGSIACKTAFKSWVKVKTTEGKTESPIIEDGQWTFNEVNPNDTLHYRVFTGADNQKGDSDEFTLFIQTFNWPYIASMGNQMMATATPQQKKAWENPEVFAEAMMTNPSFNISRLWLTYYQQIHTTNSSGDYQGTVKLPPNWPTGIMAVTLQYGYNNDARSTDFARGFENFYEAASWVVFAIEVFVLGLSCPFSAGAGCVALAGLMAAEIAVLTYEQLNQGLRAQIGRNKYGCSFPEGGFNQIYTFTYVNPSNDPFLQASPELKELLEDEELPVNPDGSVNKEMILLGVAFTGFLIALGSIMKGSES